MPVNKLEDCEHNEGFCDDETCVGEVDNCRVGDQGVIIAELVEALTKAHYWFLNKYEYTEELPDGLMVKIEKALSAARSES